MPFRNPLSFGSRTKDDSNRAPVSAVASTPVPAPYHFPPNPSPFPSLPKAVPATPSTSPFPAGIRSRDHPRLEPRNPLSNPGGNWNVIHELLADVEDGARESEGTPDDGDDAHSIGGASKKRSRTLTTAHQTAVLNSLLATTRFPSTETREEIGQQIGMSSRRVQIWFQNRRQSQKRTRNREGESETSSLHSHPGRQHFGNSPADASPSHHPYANSHHSHSHRSLNRPPSVESFVSYSSAQSKTSSSYNRDDPYRHPSIGDDRSSWTGGAPGLWGSHHSQGPLDQRRLPTVYFPAVDRTRPAASITTSNSTARGEPILDEERLRLPSLSSMFGTDTSMFGGPVSPPLPSPGAPRRRSESPIFDFEVPPVPGPPQQSQPFLPSTCDSSISSNQSARSLLSTNTKRTSVDSMSLSTVSKFEKLGLSDSSQAPRSSPHGSLNSSNDPLASFHRTSSSHGAPVNACREADAALLRPISSNYTHFPPPFPVSNSKPAIPSGMSYAPRLPSLSSLFLSNFATPNSTPPASGSPSSPYTNPNFNPYDTNRSYMATNRNSLYSLTEGNLESKTLDTGFNGFSTEVQDEWARASKGLGTLTAGVQTRVIVAPKESRGVVSHHEAATGTQDVHMG